MTDQAGGPETRTRQPGVDEMGGEAKAKKRSARAMPGRCCCGCCGGGMSETPPKPSGSSKSTGGWPSSAKVDMGRMRNRQRKNSATRDHSQFHNVQQALSVLGIVQAPLCHCVRRDALGLNPTSTCCVHLTLGLLRLWSSLLPSLALGLCSLLLLRKLRFFFCDAWCLLPFARSSSLYR